MLFPISPDDTYMYDDAARGALGRNNQGHWYDEPPYESDPDDFLMSGMGPAATIQVLCSFYSLCESSSIFFDTHTPVPINPE